MVQHSLEGGKWMNPRLIITTSNVFYIFISQLEGFTKCVRLDCLSASAEHKLTLDLLNALIKLLIS